MRFFVTTAIILILAGCSSSPTLPASDASMWNNVKFQKNIAVTVIAPDDIFALPTSLQKELERILSQRLSDQERANYLLKMVYGEANVPFLYNKLNSTIANETWERKRGDCISLTILAYAMGKKLRLPIRMQEVDIPVQFDRHENTDYVNSHVNAIILNPQLQLNNFGRDSGYVLIDFDPDSYSMRRGRLLTENGIIARFYNNIGVEYLSKNKNAEAYAYFKAAIVADPSYSFVYGNLAHLYQRENLIAHAESILHAGLQIQPNDPIMLRRLQNVFFDQGKFNEATEIKKRLQAYQEKDPYYWLGLGLNAMQKRDYFIAINYLEKADALSSGFEEVHQNLAEAYTRVGDLTRAQTQIAALGNINPENTKFRYLRTKFSGQ